MVNGKRVIVKKFDEEAISNVVVSVREVSSDGIVIVRFSEPIYVPLNYTNFTSKELDITYQSNLNKNVTLQSWNVTNLDDSYMEIALKFSDPTRVS